MNYTVLVVDDEAEQRSALISRVDWSAAGFEVIGEAENGVEALDLIDALEPDLILTDIRMPMISGLELAAKVYEMRPATQIVILSGYDSFDYARTAINYNIISYLLKPITSAEMSKELFSIRRRMDERLGNTAASGAAADGDIMRELHRLRTDEFLLPLLLGSNENKPDDAELSRHARELGILAEEGENGEKSDDGSDYAADGAKRSTPLRFVVTVSKFKNEEGKFSADAKRIDFVNRIMSRYLRSESLAVYGRIVTLAVIYDKGEMSNILELPLREVVQSAKRMLGERCTVGVSREFSQLSDASDAYFQAVTARRYTSDGSGDVRFINDQERDPETEIERVEKTVTKLEQLLKVGGSDSVSGFVNGLYESSTPENANLLVAEIIATVYRVVSSVSDRGDVMKLLGDNPIFARITSNNSESVMKNELISFCESAKELISRSQKRETEILCDRVIQIIDERYSDEDLLLTEVSNILAVSPNYLSALIKKTKKKNFSTLLTEKRMRAAHDMLVCTNMKVLEVSERCGYSDQHYFSYCFKKFYGESPSTLRNRLHPEG